MKVKLDLTYQDAHILTKMLEDGCYPHILDQINKATGKATAHRLSGLIIEI